MSIALDRGAPPLTTRDLSRAFNGAFDYASLPMEWLLDVERSLFDALRRSWQLEPVHLLARLVVPKQLLLDSFLRVICWSSIQGTCNTKCNMFCRHFHSY